MTKKFKEKRVSPMFFQTMHGQVELRQNYGTITIFGK